MSRVGICELREAGAFDPRKGAVPIRDAMEGLSGLKKRALQRALDKRNALVKGLQDAGDKVYGLARKGVGVGGLALTGGLAAAGSGMASEPQYESSIVERAKLKEHYV